ncbi:ABC transporter substrate-binding protein [Hydrogenophaga sp.]|uniref:ABC transporter substrate-binding protein n=1 Tax=Hydrogenophaga sp. TaxID=1904254 RepID=UPI002715F40C|nr:ABC transporter substrate-binding protein [Hydrogenophaga sp.]MDO9433830.1 ABC transporter substrate-binding protein [Hydrogenophaga sp.]
MAQPQTAPSVRSSIHPGRPARVGLIHYVGRGDPYVGTDDVLWFKDAMARLGYREGDGVDYLELYGDRDFARTQQHARQVLEWKPDVVVSFMTNANLALKPLLETHPVPVVCWATDLMEAGLIESHRRPGGHFTGFTFVPGNNWGKVRLAKLLLPKVRRIGHLYNPTYSPAPSCLRELAHACEAIGVELPAYETLTKEAFQGSVDAMARDGCDAVIVGPHELFNTNGKILGDMFLAAGLPAIGNQLSMLEGGGVASINSGGRQGWPLMAFVVDDILHGAQPADIPVNRFCRGPLTINLKSARALGLDVTDEILEEVDVLLD